MSSTIINNNTPPVPETQFKPSTDISFQSTAPLSTADATDMVTDTQKVGRPTGQQLEQFLANEVGDIQVTSELDVSSSVPDVLGVYQNGAAFSEVNVYVQYGSFVPFVASSSSICFVCDPDTQVVSKAYFSQEGGFMWFDYRSDSDISDYNEIVIITNDGDVDALIEISKQSGNEGKICIALSKYVSESHLKEKTLYVESKENEVWKRTAFGGALVISLDTSLNETVNNGLCVTDQYDAFAFRTSLTYYLSTVYVEDGKIADFKVGGNSGTISDYADTIWCETDAEYEEWKSTLTTGNKYLAVVGKVDTFEKVQDYKATLTDGTGIFGIYQLGDSNKIVSNFGVATTQLDVYEYYCKENAIPCVYVVDGAAQRIFCPELGDNPIYDVPYDVWVNANMSGSTTQIFTSYSEYDDFMTSNTNVTGLYLLLDSPVFSVTNIYADVSQAVLLRGNQLLNLKTSKREIQELIEETVEDQALIEQGTEAGSIKQVNTQYPNTAQYRGGCAFGSGTSSTGGHSFTEGFNTKASGYASHAEGTSTTASGESSHAEGDNTKATGEQSHAEGYNTKASGTGSHAEGGNTKSLGISTHAEGVNTIASGDRSHAEGSGTQANGINAHAEGGVTQANGGSSHAEGEETEANGDRSHAEGHGTQANGINAHAEGSYTKTSNDSEHASGKYNKSTSDTLFSIGNGTGDSDTYRNNAVEVKQNGDIYFGGAYSSESEKPIPKICYRENNGDFVDIIKIIKYLTPAATYAFTFSAAGTDTYNAIPSATTKTGTLTLAKSFLGETTYPETTVTLKKSSKAYTDTSYADDDDYGTITVIDNSTCNGSSYTVDFGTINWGSFKYIFTDSVSSQTTIFQLMILKPLYYWMSSVDTASAVDTTTYFSKKSRITGSQFSGDSYTTSDTGNKYVFLAIPVGWQPTTCVVTDAMGSTTNTMTRITANVQVGDDATNLYDIYRTEATWQNITGLTFTFNGSSNSAF